MPNFLYKTRFRARLLLHRVWSCASRSSDSITAAFTALLAAATLALVIAAIVQHADTVEAIAATNRLAGAAEASATENRRLAAAAELSAKTAEETLRTTRENFRSTERRYIWLTNDTDLPQLLPPQSGTEGRVAWDWKYTNYGKSPALGIHFEHFIRLGDRQWEPSYSRRGPGPPLPPNKVDRATVLSSPEIDQEEFNRLWSTDEGISISGKITYSDAYEGDYATTFCLAKLATGAVHYCTDRNGNSMR